MKYIKISKIQKENKLVKTFYFSAQGGSASGGDFHLKSQPGQFIMLWIPEIDQKPFSIAYDDGKTFGLTIFKRGPLTEKLFSMEVGDRVGISGPYGTTFSVKPNTHYIMVAGGYGAAPLGFLANEVVKEKNTKIDFIAGARSAEFLLFEERLSKIPNLNLHFATDDGSRGYKGYVTDLLPALIESNNASKDPSTPLRSAQDDNFAPLVVTCGPELMQKKVLDICNQYNVDCEVSIERYMKCGIGVCGQCVVDDLGICMCKEGPVVKRELANKIIEFGKYYRDKSGSIINF